MQELYLGRQPILDRNRNLIAFELLFRAGDETDAVITNGSYATANVIANAYCELGVQSVLGNRRGFINVDAELLMSDVIHLLPQGQVVLELLEQVDITDEIVQRCAELKKAGYQLALDDVTQIKSGMEKILPIINIVKVDVLDLGDSVLKNLVNELKRWPVVLLAEKVETAERAEFCQSLGFEMFQGYYYARPQVIISGKRTDPSKMALLQLLSLVMQDSDVEEIEQEFKHQPDLSFNLMRMVNSVASGVRSKVTSIRQGIILLGRKQLQRWIQLLLYTSAQPGESMDNALMQTAAIRGKFMELIAIVEFPNDREYHENAFMVGILSLLDVLLYMTMDEIVDALDVPERVRIALLRREGTLGKIIGLVEANEKGDVIVVRNMLSKLGFLQLSTLIKLELEAVKWANQIGESSD